MLLPKPGHVEFERVPAGTYVARCYRFLDLGTQPKIYQGQTKLQHQIRLSWELPTELMEKGDNAGKPFSVHETYSWTMHEKGVLRKTLEGWRGKKFVDTDFGPTGFDTKKLLGVPCMIGISNTEKNGTVYADVASVSPLLKGYEMPKAVNEPLYFSFDDLKGLPKQAAIKLLDDVFTKLTQKTRELLMRCPEYQEAIGNGHVEEENHTMSQVPESAYEHDDGIPF